MELQIIAALAFLAAKHFVADYLLQTPYQYRNKGRYGHPGGLLHAVIHGIASLPVLLIVPAAGVALGLAVVAGEMAIHYHMDWLKERLVADRGLGHKDAAYWQILGFDQLVHQLTYVAMVALLIGWPR